MMKGMDDLRRQMGSMQGMVSEEALEKLQNSMKVQAAKKSIEGKLNSNKNVDKDILLGAIRRMMEQK